MEQAWTILENQLKKINISEQIINKINLKLKNETDPLEKAQIIARIHTIVKNHKQIIDPEYLAEDIELLKNKLNYSKWLDEDINRSNHLITFISKDSSKMELNLPKVFYEPPSRNYVEIEVFDDLNRQIKKKMVPLKNLYEYLPGSYHFDSVSRSILKIDAGKLYTLGRSNIHYYNLTRMTDFGTKWRDIDIIDDRFRFFPEKVNAKQISRSIVGIHAQSRATNLRFCPNCLRVWDGFEIKNPIFEFNHNFCSECLHREIRIQQSYSPEDLFFRWLIQTNRFPGAYPINKLYLKDNQEKQSVDFDVQCLQNMGLSNIASLKGMNIEVETEGFERGLSIQRENMEFRVGSQTFRSQRLKNWVQRQIQEGGRIYFRAINNDTGEFTGDSCLSPAVIVHQLDETDGIEFQLHEETMKIDLFE